MNIKEHEAVIVIKNHQCYVMSKHEEIHKYLYDMLATPVLEDMKYTESFKLGLIDGKIHVYRNKTFRLGLLKHVETLLKLKGYDYTVIGSAPVRVRGEDTRMVWNDRYRLRPYQSVAVRRAIKCNGILSLPTGSGKTLIAARLIKYINTTTCFVVPSRVLLYQTQEVLSHLLNIEVGIVGDGKTEIRSVNVCSIQTLYSALTQKHLADNSIIVYDEDEDVFISQKESAPATAVSAIVAMIERTQCVIFDECHHLAAGTFAYVAREFPSAWRYGLSATVWREDKKEIIITQHLGGIIYTIGLGEMIAGGYLVPPRIDILHPGYYSNQKEEEEGRRLDYSKAREREYFVENDQRNGIIVQRIVQAVRKEGYQRVLVLCSFVDHVTVLAARIQAQDIPTIGITGKMKKKDRVHHVKRFEQGEVTVIVSTDIFGEGFDLPAIDAVLIAQIGKSTTKLYQYIGRALRPYEGKDHALIIDLADNYRWFAGWFMYRLGAYVAEDSFLDNFTSAAWKKKAEIIKREVDKGQKRLIYDIDE